MKGVIGAGLLAAVLSSCSGPQALEVKPYHLREVSASSDDEPLLRAEQMRRLHGAVGVREQEQRRGHYFNVSWHDEAGAGSGAAQVVFEYQQAATGSTVKRQVADFAAAEESGEAEFRVIGDDYLGNGRVLAWRCRLLRGGREVARRHSYLWE